MADPDANRDAKAEGAPPATDADMLYDLCRKAAAASPEKDQKSFNQDDLLALCECDALAHINDVTGLMPLIQDLSNSGLFVSLKDKSGNFWALRTRPIAAKLQELPKDVRTVYAVIEEAHQAGAWLRTLKSKIGIKDGKSLGKMLATLIRANLIKDVTNVKSAGKKYYMLAHLTPSDDLTGGSFFDSGALDASMVNDLSDFIVFHVRQHSWMEEKRKKGKREASPVMTRDDDAARNKKRKRDSAGISNSKDIEDAGPPRKQHRHTVDAEPTQLAYPAGHEYPTATSIYKFITQNNILQGAKAASLAVEEVENVLNVLCWDEKLEKVGIGYRSVRGVKPNPLGEPKRDFEDDKTTGRGNALTEMPCGQCPVFSICGTGGIINAANCTYFDSWLGFAEPAVSASAAAAAGGSTAVRATGVS